MEFCPKCGSMILVKDKKAACVKCGYRPKGSFKVESSEKIEKRGGVAVINEKALNTYPVVKIKCGECENNQAYFWTMQTRSSDESETKFYKCTKCEHTWRVYR